jgi:hypothetical protein
MEESIINPTKLNIYGINSFINKFGESKLEIIDLETLKNNFKIDYEVDESVNKIDETALPAFTQLTFNKRIKETDTSYSESYNRPPIGPIENFCYCSYCNNISPQYHTEECPFPEKKSIYLTIQGIYYYIIQNTKEDFSDKINKLKKMWLSSELTQELLNKFLLIPNSAKVKDGIIDKIILNKTLTNIPYLDIVKTRGPNKLAYKTQTEKFSNAVMLSYEYLSKEFDSNTDSDTTSTKKTSIRIYKNGLINLINEPSNKLSRETLYKMLIDRINDSDVIDIDNFNQISSEYTDEEYDEYSIVDKASYTHSINSQFYMWEIKDKYEINFNKLTDLITPLNSSGRIVSGDFTEVDVSGNKQLIELQFQDKKVQIINWEFIGQENTQNESSDNAKRKIIKCIIIPKDGIKISLQIYRHGTFQMSMSYCNMSDVKNSICKKLLDKTKNPLNPEYFELVKYIFTNIFKLKSGLYGKSLEYLDDKSSIMRNTVSGNAPPNKEGTTTAVCRSRDPRPGYPSLRPLPYSFNGRCPEYRQYINPTGILGNDGLYYPCCAAKTKKSDEDYKTYLIEGFPKNKTESIEYGVTSVEDTKSGILIPGSLNIGSITKAKIDSVWVPIKLIGYKGKSIKPQELLVQNLETNKVITVNRDTLERDSRYFPGLKKLDKDQLIRCILKNLNSDNADSTILQLENLEQIRKLITLPDPKFNPTLSAYNIPLFKKIKYYVTSVPNSSDIYYFHINNSESYLINSVGNKKTRSLTDTTINEEIILFGFLEKNSEKYYVTDILYFNKKVTLPFLEKLNMLKEIQETYFLTEENIEFCYYEKNIIKGSNELLLESSDIYLVFTPEINYLDFKVWTNLKINPEITLQIIRKLKTNHFVLGYDNNPLTIVSDMFNDIFIKKDFIDNNQIKIHNYISFKFDYNLQTGKLSSRSLIPIEKTEKPKLSYTDTLTKLSLIINPIQESFFTNNKLEDDYVWNVPGKDVILKSIGDDLPLVDYE